MSDDVSDPRVPEPHSPGRSIGNGRDALETARVRAIYTVLGLIIVLAVVSIIPQAQVHIDLGVFATLMGGLVSLLGLGAVIRLVGR